MVGILSKRISTSLDWAAVIPLVPVASEGEGGQNGSPGRGYRRYGRGSSSGEAAGKLLEFSMPDLALISCSASDSSSVQLDSASLAEPAAASTGSAATLLLISRGLSKSAHRLHS